MPAPAGSDVLENLVTQTMLKMGHFMDKHLIEPVDKIRNLVNARRKRSMADEKDLAALTATRTVLQQMLTDYVTERASTREGITDSERDAMFAKPLRNVSPGAGVAIVLAPASFAALTPPTGRGCGESTSQPNRV